MDIKLERRTLHFKRPARTSRGEYTEHEMVLVSLSDKGNQGVGECAPLPDLSYDRGAYRDLDEVESLIRDAIGDAEPGPELDARVAERLRAFPALLFAVESALAQLATDAELYGTAFARAQVGIPVNGLVWMADHDEMLRQIGAKLKDGYKCIKLKIGAIGWEEEMDLVKFVRSRFGEEELQLRVDANGAFSGDDVFDRLEELSHFGIHSIEQPVRQGQWELMAALCRERIIPIALDEELIGLNSRAQRLEMLDVIKPQYIVVKPGLHGGLSGAREWVGAAAERGIGSWITSALESNVGLRSIALLTASIYGVDASTMAQGLGTGLLYTDNIDTGIELRDGRIWISERVEQPR